MTPGSFPVLPRSARAYVAAVSIAGGVVLLDALPAAVEVHPVLLAGFLGLSLLASMAKVTIPVPGSDSSLTVCHVIDYTTLLVCGPAAAIAVAAWGGWTQCTFCSPGGNAPHRVVFSVATLALTMRLTGVVYAWMGGQPGIWVDTIRLETFAAAATACFLVNSGLVAGAVGLATGRSIASIWFDAFLSSWPSYAIGAGLSVALAIVVERQTYWVLPLLAAPLVLLHRNFTTYLQRVSEAMTDPVTRLPNQRSLAEHLQRMLGPSGDNARLAVIFLDLDNFKTINDRGGHASGDVALRRVAEVLQANVRAHDACARYGGDEFVLVLAGCGRDEAISRQRDVEAAIGRIRVEIGAGAHIGLAVSGGVAVFPDDGDTVDRLLAIADARMYQQKFQRFATLG